MIGKNVFTSDGEYFGQIDDVNLAENRIDGWKIRVGSSFLSIFGGARGVIVPHQFVKAMGDVIIINRGSLPSKSDEPDFASPQASSTGEESILAS